ncbi:MAG: glycosyltransferase, partial [Muribaculaceae bacterium]|nr:glycosyltransferase [Muribaculaceae bacterium]
HTKFGQYPNLKENENLIYYGLTPNPEKLLQAGDVFVLPTYREGFGMSVLEASSVGLPVICSDTYGVLDAMVDDETGLRCKTMDVESLKKCMLKLYSDQDLRNKLGTNGRRRVEEKFSSDVVTDAWLDFYKSLL